MGAFYIPLLTRLVTTTKQDHRRVASNGVVDAVPLANMNAHLADALANGLVVTKVAFLNAVDTDGDTCPGLLVTQPFQPTPIGK